MSKHTQEELPKITTRRLLSNVRFILNYAYRYDKVMVIWTFAAFILCGLIYAWFDTLFLKTFIEMMQNEGKGFVKCIIYVLISVLIAYGAGLMEVLVSNLAEARFVKVTGRVQEDFIKKASSIDLMCYDNGKYFDNYVVAASQAEEMIISGVITVAAIFGAFSSIIGVGALIMTINPVIAIFPLVGFVINMMTRFKITKLEYDYDVLSKQIMRRADYSKRVFYQPEYAKEIKLSDIEIPLRKQFNVAIQDVQKEAHKIGFKIAMLSLINWIFVFTFMSHFCVPLYLGYLALVKKSVKLGDVAAMNSAQQNVSHMLDAMNYYLVRFQTVGQFAEKFREFLAYEVKIEGQTGSEPVPDQIESLVLDHVSFRYESNDYDTLHDVSITIRPGEKIAIVGENGAGKTTFVKLLMRLYDVTEGSIRYGKTDIRKFSTKEYRDVFGAVFQDFQIYGATLADNVLMEVSEGEDVKERVEKALELADFGKKYAKLPDGIHTQMTREFSDHGTMLSGGESQKVAIARMFAKRHKLSIAILDEPSSALDPFAEYTLNKNMMESVSEASVIFISHRLSTTRDADCIYLFEHGRIIESGKHEELMNLGGHYAEMFEKQAHYYQEEVSEAVS